MIPELFDLTGKTALVTGASSGIGRRFAQVLSEAGARVIAVARREERLQELREELARKKREVVIRALDLRDSSAIERVLRELTGQHRIDILINNAGIGRATPIFADNTTHDFEEQFQTNFFALWHMTRIVARHMKEKQIPGSIINISSISGALAPSCDIAAYSASKAAVIQLTKQLVGELAPFQIRINVIIPGMVRTERSDEYIEANQEIIKKCIPLGFAGELEDLDAAILYFSSNRASRYVTGSSLTIDGGHSWDCGRGLARDRHTA